MMSGEEKKSSWRRFWSGEMFPDDAPSVKEEIPVNEASPEDSEFDKRQCFCGCGKKVGFLLRPSNETAFYVSGTVVDLRLASSDFELLSFHLYKRDRLEEKAMVDRRKERIDGLLAFGEEFLNHTAAELHGESPAGDGPGDVVQWTHDSIDALRAWDPDQAMKLRIADIQGEA